MLYHPGNPAHPGKPARKAATARKGATVLECAVVYPVTFLLLLGLLIGGLGVFRYQEVAWLSREAARYAAVRGSDYQKETGNTPPTQQQIIDDVVKTMAAAMDKTKLTVTVFWIDGVGNKAVPWDSSTKAPTGVGPNGTVSHRVRVTVTYQWMPEAFLVGPINLKSTCEIPMAF